MTRRTTSTKLPRLRLAILLLTILLLTILLLLHRLLCAELLLLWHGRLAELLLLLLLMVKLLSSMIDVLLLSLSGIVYDELVVGLHHVLDRQLMLVELGASLVHTALWLWWCLGHFRCYGCWLCDEDGGRILWVEKREVTVEL